ncbi:MAG TPA: hypothetical protein VNX26_17870 [Candidatus Acidoferrum sp.]|jgi:hypothetical protein|nr:hypothetical protein [Candidatus Acidoferrum sp.]
MGRRASSEQLSPYSFVVFPFLKTSGVISIGGIDFRSTDDTASLSPDQAVHVSEIARMLFLQDDYRVKSASYATVPYVDLENQRPLLTGLERLQAIVAYCYAAPHEIFGHPFLHYEDASLAVFSPSKVSIHTVRPEHHTEPIAPLQPVEADQFGFVQGYSGLYNFKHHFCVVSGSRVYPPVPEIVLNISQNLAADFGQWSRGYSHYQLLLASIERPSSVTLDRVFTAMKWFNAANSRTCNEESAIVYLAIALETILGLPEGKGVTERFTDAVSLLLGRTPRLDIWADQFYGARSDVVHRGQTNRVRFVASDSKNKGGPQYRSLLSYGQQVFRFCVESVLFGAKLAQGSGLAEKLVTNQERFTEVCSILNDKSSSPTEKFQRISPLADAADRFRHISESGLEIGAMIGCARAVAQAVLECTGSLESNLREALDKLARTDRTDVYSALDALRGLHEIGQHSSVVVEQPNGPLAVTLRLTDVIWSYTFWHYFSEKQRRESGQQE